MMNKAARNLEKVERRVLGVVLNKVPQRGAGALLRLSVPGRVHAPTTQAAERSA